MKPYALDQIIIPEGRQRQEFDPRAMEELRTSIDGGRLLHAPVVREEAGQPVLVAGERRLRAIRDIFALGGSFEFDGQQYNAQIGLVPTVTLGELSELEAEEAELDENLRRKDLTWQEHSQATRKLHLLRAKQKLLTASPFEDLPQTIAETTRELNPELANVPAGELGYHAEQVRREVIVAKHLDNPDVAKAKSLDEAWKVLKKSEKSMENIALAAKVGATFTAELHQAYHSNCLDWMDQAIMDGKEFDVILTDPPYGMGADSFGDGGKALPTHQYKDNYETWLPLMEAWTKRSFLLAKPQAHAYVFCDIDRFHELKLMMQLAGWYVFRTPIIDFKEGSGRVPLPDRGPRRCWEMVLYAIKGNKPVTNIYPDVIQCRADENMTHGAQKPVALYQNLLMRSVRPGDTVLDTFAGSGTIFPAAHAMQCIATGIEMNPEYFGMCLTRLQALKNQADPLSELDLLK